MTEELKRQVWSAAFADWMAYNTWRNKPGVEATQDAMLRASQVVLDLETASQAPFADAIERVLREVGVSR